MGRWFQTHLSMKQCGTNKHCCSDSMATLGQFRHGVWRHQPPGLQLGDIRRVWGATLDLTTTVDAGRHAPWVPADSMELSMHGISLWICGCFSGTAGADGLEDYSMYIPGTMETPDLACVEHAVQPPTRLARRCSWTISICWELTSLYGCQLRVLF